MKKLVGTVAALLIGGLVVSGFMITTEPTASARVSCAAKGTKCGEHSYDANNDMCCSQHCSWSNPDQKYECE